MRDTSELGKQKRGSMCLGQSEAGAVSKSFEVGMGTTCYNYVNCLVHGEMVLER